MSYVEPFRAPLTEGPPTYHGDLRIMEGRDDCIVRVEPANELGDLVEYRRALKLFTELSGIEVVPFAMAVGEAKPLDGDAEAKYGHNRSFPATFYLTDRIIFDAPAETDDPFAFPPDVTRQLAGGLANYFVQSFFSGDAYSYEIRPHQFMYGRALTDVAPKLYMVDLDYALSAQMTAGEVLSKLNDLVDYLSESHPSPLFTDVAEKILQCVSTVSTFANEKMDQVNNSSNERYAYSYRQYERVLLFVEDFCKQQNVRYPKIGL